MSPILDLGQRLHMQPWSGRPLRSRHGSKTNGVSLSPKSERSKNGLASARTYVRSATIRAKHCCLTSQLNSLEGRGVIWNMWQLFHISGTLAPPLFTQTLFDKEVLSQKGTFQATPIPPKPNQPARPMERGGAYCLIESPPVILGPLPLGRVG